ncbi:MAG: hypothetical protein ACK5PZ_08210, partial [Pirellula sp.]
MSLFAISNPCWIRITFVPITLLVAFAAVFDALHAQSPDSPQVLIASLGNEAKLELVHVPPGEFMMGSTQEEKDWATGIEGGAQPGTERESDEGEMP